MVLQNPNSIAVRSTRLNIQHPTTTTSVNTTNNSNNNSGTMGHQRPVIDLLVAMVAVPIMILCALQLEKNLHDMASSPESRWVVFALGIGMLVISVVICGYITHRMGVCMWTGPIDELGNRTDGHNILHINSQNDILRIVDSLPPSYESVVKFDIPPPPYDCLVIDMEACKEETDVVETTNPTSSPSVVPQTNNNSPSSAMPATLNDGKLFPIEVSAMHI